MKQRLITAGVGLILFFVALFFYWSIVFDIILCLIAMLIVHELLLALKVTKNIPLTVVSLAMTIIPFLSVNSKRFINGNSLLHFVPAFLLGAVALMFLILLKYHETLSFEKVASAFFVGLVVPFSMITFVELRNDYGVIRGVYYTLLVFACAWGADSGAYFAGRFLGKRKLSPKISPNKTVEGVYGGVISCLLFVAVITTIYFYYQQSQGIAVEIKWVYLIIMSVVGSLVGVLGDLTASVIKRQTGIKDFGSIMPGHGGALDRFDSVLFVAPVLAVFFKFLPI